MHLPTEKNMYLSAWMVIVFLALVAIGYFLVRQHRLLEPLADAQATRASLKKNRKQPFAEAMHFWDTLDWNTPSGQQPVSIAEDFPRYGALLNALPYAEAEKAIVSLLKKAAHKERLDLYRYFVVLSKEYWHNPNAISTNERLYAVVLRQVVQCNRLDSYERKSAQETLDLLNRNNPGNLAEDFIYTTWNGKRYHLYTLEAPYTLLFFYNPECHACQRVLEEMKQDKRLTKAIQHQELTVLAVYIDADEQVWKNHLAEMPSTWIHGYDKHQQITLKRSYDLKAIPTLYVLNRDKRVLLKDASWPQIASHLFQSLP